MIDHSAFLETVQRNVELVRAVVTRELRAFELATRHHAVIFQPHLPVYNPGVSPL